MSGCMCICCSGCAVHEIGVLSTSAWVHVQVCTLRQVSVETSVHIYKYILRRVCTCAVCSLALGDESGGVQLVYAGHLLLAWGVIFDRRRDRGVVCIFSMLTKGWSHGMCVCVCIYAHTPWHTNCTWGTGMWLGAQGSGWDTWRARKIQVD